MSRSLASALEKLLARGDEAAVSLFGNAQRRALEQLARATGHLTLRTQGRGNVFHVQHRAALEAHLQTLRPQGAESLPAGLPRRAVNVATARDSKAGGSAHALHYLLLKAAGTDVCWRHADGRAFDLSAATAACGAGVLAIASDDGWQSGQPLWLVENQALFDRLDWLPPDTQASIVYYAGQIPARVLAWLAARARAPEVILFPDYDGVGLHNYARLLAQCRAPCSFWLMPGWHALLMKYGNNRIWQDNHAEFIAAVEELTALKAADEVLALCAALSQAGLALEHEAVWLGPPAS